MFYIVFQCFAHHIATEPKHCVFTIHVIYSLRQSSFPLKRLAESPVSFTPSPPWIAPPEKKAGYGPDVVYGP